MLRTFMVHAANGRSGVARGVGIVLATSLALGGCAAAGPTPSPKLTSTLPTSPTQATATDPVLAASAPPGSTSLPDVPFTIDASARAAGTDRVRVTGTTNLPAGSVIEIAASRALRNGGETDIRESPAGDATVTLSD